MLTHSYLLLNLWLLLSRKRNLPPGSSNDNNKRPCWMETFPSQKWKGLHLKWKPFIARNGKVYNWLGKVSSGTHEEALVVNLPVVSEVQHLPSLFSIGMNLISYYYLQQQQCFWMETFPAPPPHPSPPPPPPPIHHASYDGCRLS